MAKPDFSGPLLKVERAEHHIGHLDTIFRDFIRSNVRRLRPKRNRRTLNRTNIPTFHKHTPTVLGDAIHNLRASLDHAYHILADANSATFDEWRKFPFGRDRQSLEGSINGHKLKGTTPSDKVIKVILEDAQPYLGGKLGLYGLHVLDITDKHLTLLPTQMVARLHEARIELLDSTGAQTGGRVTGGTWIIPDPQNGCEFFDVGPNGAKFYGDPKRAFHVRFGEGQPFEGDEVLETIKSLRSAVVETLNMLREAA